MSESTKSDAADVQPVQLPEGTKIFKVLGDAFDRDDAAAVRALVPGLTQKEAASLLFHTRRRERARAQLSGSLYYGLDTWGRDPANVPAVVLSGTRKVRVALILWDARKRDLDVSREDAERIVAANMAGDIADGHFWFAPVYSATLDIGDGCDLSNARRMARRSALIFEHRAQLRAAHRAAQRVLAEAGLPWALLAEYAKGDHGDEHAIEKQQQAEREALAAIA